MEEDTLPAAGSTSRSNGLLAVFEKFQHLDRVLRECETADDPIYRTCAALWIAVAEAQTANTRNQGQTPQGENHE
jgi:hypothetical protein